ncbi:Ig-like domain-containing protein [Paenibacillus barengoltzii]|uniref:Ig-like domain-containing protein n=1 Tax=Paenibacillus barengoltzii TaxID=343517 RepID=UPI002FDAE029
MSNTSYSFKENSHVIVNQGGEKKVMKKILSVALSTAMAFSMFASVAFGADAKLTPEQQFNALKEAGIVSGFPDGLSHLERTLTRAELAKIIVNSLSLEPVDATSYNDKNYANHWGRPYIEAATQAGILNGKDAVKKLFDPNGAVTVQELAKVLVTALKLEVPADANNTASEWAKGYVAAAVNAGYLADGINYQAQATRSQAVVAAYAIYEAAQVPTVKSYTVVDSKNVEFTLSNGEVVKVALEKALEPNKATEVTFKTADGKEIKASVTWVVTEASKVESVSASNLKQVVVAFDGEVDKATAEDASNYTLSNNLTVESASLSADGKTVTLTLKGDKPSDVMTNQKEYKLSFNNVKAGSKVLSVKDFKFTPLDNSVPTATKVEALGNKTVKVTFSEPIYRANASSITIDGKAAVGYAEVAGNVVIFKLYSTLENAEHTISIANVEDFVPFKSAPQELKFTVVEDKEAPTVAAVEKASFETVRIKFSEPVDKTTVLGSNVYWLQGSTKKYAGTNVTQISDDTYEFDFSANRIQYATTLYLNGIKDYSGNTIAADTKVEVNPVVDQTRPEVVNAELKDDNKTFVIKFSKSLLTSSANDSAHYIVRDADGNEVRKSKTAVLRADGKTVDVTLVQALDLGKTYTLEVAGVQDTTILGNSSLPFSKKFEVANTSKATVSVDRLVADNKIVVSFSKTVALSGEGAATSFDKYYYSKDNGTTWNKIPDSTDLRVSPDSKSVILTFDEDDLKVNDITNFRVQLIKDTDDQYINGLYQDFNSSTIGTGAAPVLKVTDAVYAVADNKIEVEFDKDLLAASVSASDFKVKAGVTELTVISAALKSDNSKVVVLTLADAFKLNSDGKYNGTNPTVTINANARTATAAGIPIAADSTGQVAGDKIAGKLTNVTATTTQVTLTFSETLKTLTGADLANVATDLELKKTNGSAVSFTVASVNGVNVVLNITGGTTESVLQVKVKDDTRFLKDASGNLIEGSDLVEFVVQ